MKQTGADASMIFVPPAGAADAIMEAADAGIRRHRRHHRGHPRPRHGPRQALPQDETRLAAHRPQLSRRHHARPVQNRHHARLHPQAVRPRRKGVGVISRCGTLTYEAVWQLIQPRLSAIHLRRHRRRPDHRHHADRTARRCSRTIPAREAILMIGEIGGTAEEQAAEYVSQAREEAGGGVHRRPDGAARPAHGPRRRDHQRRQRQRARTRSPPYRRPGSQSPPPPPTWDRP